LQVRTFFPVMLWGLAAVGAGWRLLVRKNLDLTVGLLFSAPFSVLGLQSYGGEVLLRIYFFVLPPTVFLVAGLFFTKTEGVAQTSWLRSSVVGVFCLALLPAFFFTRYGNEKMDYVTHEDFAIMEALYDIADPGAILITPSWNVSLRYQYIDRYEWVTLTEQLDTNYLDIPLEVLAVVEDNPETPVYVIFSRSQLNYGTLFIGLPDAWQHHVERLLLPYFDRVFSNRDGSIYALKDGISVPLQPPARMPAMPIPN
jgi:hypothetical protein